MRVAGFEWDGGNRDKWQKHGVSPAVLERLFIESMAIVPDPTHSGTEARFKAIGRSQDGRGVLVVFTLRTRREERFIRPISARYMHPKEFDHYEK